MKSEMSHWKCTMFAVTNLDDTANVVVRDDIVSNIGNGDIRFQEQLCTTQATNQRNVPLHMLYCMSLINAKFYKQNRI